jgi:hypothetical protein
MPDRNSDSSNRTTSSRNDEVEEWTTYHEAGHCVLAVACGARVERASVEPEESDFHGLVQIEWDHRANRMDQIAVSLAGPVAEMIYRGDPFHPGLIAEWAMDWKQAWTIARPGTKSDQECLRLLEMLTAKLHRQFSSDSWWAAIAAVSDLLGAHQEIEHDDIAYEVNVWIPVRR